MAIPKHNDWALEPLTHDGIWFVDANGNQLGGQEAELDKATLDRLIACYNACAGVPTEALETIQDFYYEIRASYQGKHEGEEPLKWDE